MMRYALATVTVCLLATLAAADEPGWTDAERAERSTAVITGEVLSIEQAAVLNEREALYRALVAIESVSKGADIARPGEQIALYYTYPKDGMAERRRPAYVSLKINQRSQFYVRLRKIGPEWRAFLELASDVREPPAKPTGT